jgi:hypothetical protein
MAPSRITEEFVGHLKELKRLTGNDPRRVRASLDANEDTATHIRELDTIAYFVNRHRQESKRRYIVQAHPEFFNAFSDYNNRWTGASSEVLDWEAERAGREPPSVWLERELSRMEKEPSSAIRAFRNDSWDFDPDEDSAASYIEALAENAGNKSDDEPFFSRAKQAYDWMTTP